MESQVPSDVSGAAIPVSVDPPGEFALIRRFFDRPAARPSAPPAAGSDGLPMDEVVALGIGDDCALLRPPPGRLLAVSSDLLVEGRHFFAGTDPAAIGHKSLAVNLSDLAAMGARPLGFTLGLALPAVDEGWLAGFCRGLFALADAHGCPLVGGDTTRGPLTIAITVFGSVAPGEALRRDAARLDDDVWVSGPLGGAALAVRQRRQRAAAGGPVPAAAGGSGPGQAPQQAPGAGSQQTPDAGPGVDPAAARRLDWPRPRLDAGDALARLAGAGLAHAAIDLSDGLAGDLGHVLAASARRSGTELGARLAEADLPVDPSVAAARRAGLSAAAARALVIAGGDDYELLFTAAAAARPAIAAALPGARRIGRIVADPGILLVGMDGAARPVAARAFDHFADPPQGAEPS